ncbi:MAG: hypothetical protein ACRC0M_07205 [Legionella sp.]
MSYLGQDLIIDNMNSYLKDELMPSAVTLNKTGVCNGLATLYAQYSLQGADKEAEFFTLLKLISLNKMHEETRYGFPSGYCLHFASQILLAYSPVRFEQHLTQLTSINMLEINKKPLTAAFVFALSTDDHSWSKLFSQLQLQADEVMIVRSVNHAISIRKEANGYVVYDPNYSKGSKRFAKEEEVVRELHNEVFHYDSGAMGLTLHVVRHPDAPPRIPDYPEAISLYKQFLSITLKPAQTGTEQFHTLQQAAACVRNAQAVEQLIAFCKPDSAELFEAAKEAVLFNNDETLPSLLNAITVESLTQEQYAMLIDLSVKAGGLKAFNILININTSIYPHREVNKLIMYAVQGGNPNILSYLIINIVPQLIKCYYEGSGPKHMQDKHNDLSTESAASFKEENKKILVTISMIYALKTGFTYAVSRGNVECIKLLTKELNRLGGQFDEKEWLQSIMAAISANQEQSLNTLIRIHPGMSVMLLSQINLSVITAANSDLGLLHTLINNGMTFSIEVADIFKKKKENSYYSIRTLLMLIIGYIQKIFGKEQISHDEDQLIATKKSQCLDLINKAQLNYPNLAEADSAFLEAQKQRLIEDLSFAQLNELSNIIKQKVLKLELSQVEKTAIDTTDQETSLTLEEYLTDDSPIVK